MPIASHIVFTMPVVQVTCVCVKAAVGEVPCALSGARVRSEGAVLGRSNLDLEKITAPALTAAHKGCVVCIIVRLILFTQDMP